MTFTFTPIGIVENNFNERTTPDTIRAAESRIILDDQWCEGLLGLEQCQQIMVIFVFDRARPVQLIQHKHNNPSNPMRGVFDLRSPDRPNPIGVTIVDLLRIDGCILYVRGLDALNRSPILDIKPA